MDDTRLPPRSVDAEAAVLGSMIRDPGAIADVLGMVRGEDFYEDAHQKVFAAIIGLWEISKPVDRVTLGEELIRRQQVEDIGGLGTIQSLWEAAPTAANAVYYSKIVRDRSIKRRLIQTGTSIVQDAYDQVGSGDDLLDGAEKSILAISNEIAQSETFGAEECVNEVCQRIDARCRNTNRGVTGVPTGFVDLDFLTSGWQPGEFIILAARPSVGKTALGAAFARHAALGCGIPTLFVSLEQSRQELTERMLCSISRVNGQHIRNGTLSADEFAALSEASDALRSAPLYINDAPMQRILQIKALGRRQKRRNRIGLILVDYVQLVEPDSRREPRHEQVAQISRQCKFMARELNVPIVVLAQLNREVEGRPHSRPRLSDLKESGALEQDADTVVLIHRLENEQMPQTKLVQLIVAKQRNGPVGDVTLVCRPESMRYENYMQTAQTPFERN